MSYTLRADTGTYTLMIFAVEPVVTRADGGYLEYLDEQLRAEIEAERYDMTRNGHEAPSGFVEVPAIKTYTAVDMRRITNAPDDRTHAPIVFRSIGEIMQSPTVVRWLLKDILEEQVIALLAGPKGTFKSFLLLHWLLTLAVRDKPVFLVSPEGAGIDRRVEAWLQVHAPDVRPDSLPLYVYEKRIDFSDPGQILAVRNVITTSKREPVLLGIDTFSKNSGALDENSNREVKAFIGQIDIGLRIPLCMGVALVLHTGHTEKGRPRGASALEADTEACYVVTRAGIDRAITVSRDRFKDAPELPPLAYTADVVSLNRRGEDGLPVTSVVLQSAEALAIQRREPTGSNQQAALGAVRQWVSEHGDIIATPQWHQLCKAQNITKTHWARIRTALIEAGWLAECVGGVRYVP